MANTNEDKLGILKSLEQAEKETEGILGMLKVDSNKAVLKTLSNIRIMIQDEPLAKGLAFNEFTQEITVGKEPIDDEFLRHLRIKFDHKFTIQFTEHDIFTVVDRIARDNSYHPIKKMIRSKNWDGIERVETLFIDYLGANDDKYIRETTRKWLAGSVARVYQPGIKFEIIPILQGIQGIGKSTIASKLGGTYFTDTLQGLGNSKDDYQMLIGAWIVELGELASMSSTKVETIKGFTSAREDKIRLPYERMTQIFKRTVSFIGTTNPKEYLKDLTGNRRFFPIPLDEKKATKNVFKLDDDTIQQIWAEAYLYYKKGEDLFIPNDDKETLALAEQYRNDATEQDLINENIEEYLGMAVGKDWNNLSVRDKRALYSRYQDSGYTDGAKEIYKTTAKEILSVVFDMDNSNRSQKSYMKQIKLMMDHSKNEHGSEKWENKTVKINGKARWGYMRT